MANEKKLDNLSKEELNTDSVKGGKSIVNFNTLDRPAEPTRVGPGNSSGSTLDSGIGREAVERNENRINPSETK